MKQTWGIRLKPLNEQSPKPAESIFAEGALPPAEAKVVPRVGPTVEGPAVAKPEGKLAPPVQTVVSTPAPRPAPTAPASTPPPAEVRTPVVEKLAPPTTVAAPVARVKSLAPPLPAGFVKTPMRNLPSGGPKTPPPLPSITSALKKAPPLAAPEAVAAVVPATAGKEMPPPIPLAAPGTEGMAGTVEVPKPDIKAAASTPPPAAPNAISEPKKLEPPAPLPDRKKAPPLPTKEQREEALALIKTAAGAAVVAKTVEALKPAEPTKLPEPVSPAVPKRYENLPEPQLFGAGAPPLEVKPPVRSPVAEAKAGPADVPGTDEPRKGSIEPPAPKKPKRTGKARPFLAKFFKPRPKKVLNAPPKTGATIGAAGIGAAVVGAAAAESVEKMAAPLSTASSASAAAAKVTPEAAPVAKKSFSMVPTTVPKVPVPEVVPAISRAERLRKRKLIGTVAFYLIFLLIVVPLLYILCLRYSSETRVEGQVIPPPGTLLCNEVWVVSDFRELASGISDDLAAERAPKLQEIQERQDHVQRAQADIAAREERIRLLNDQISEAKADLEAIIKKAHDDAQKIWDGPGADLEASYQAKMNQIQAEIADRARTLKLNYAPDPAFPSPEVWANAYRLALYQTPPGVDGTKEHLWIENELNSWHAFSKQYDLNKEKLREQAAQIQLSPSSQVGDFNARIDDLQHRIDSTQAEEDPLKEELAQAQADLAQSQSEEQNLDGKFYQELDALPEQSITKRIPLDPNGRFSWHHVEKDSAFSPSNKFQTYWLFCAGDSQGGMGGSSG